MAAPVGSLIVKIGSDIRGLTIGLEKSSSKLKDFGAAAQRISKRIALIATASAAAGAALVTKLTRDGLKAVDSMAKFARVIGVSTERLAGLQHAAAQTAGFTSQQFDLAFQRATRRIAEAAQGTGEAQGALEKLGLSAKELAKAGPDEAFLLIADAMQNVDDQGERLRLGFKLFDSEGARLVNTLGEGREEIERLAREAKTLGLAFSDVDARQVEAANDAMARLGGIVAGVSRTLAVKLSPFIQEIAERIQKAALNAGGFGTQIENAILGAIRAAGFLSDLFRGIEITAKALALAIQKIWAGFLSGINSAARAWTRFENLIRSGTNDIIAALNKIPGVEIDRVATVTQRFAGIKREADAAAIGVELLTTELAELMRQPMPSAAVEDFLRSVRERSREAAADAAAGGGPGSPPGRDLEREARAKALEERLEQIRMGLRSEREVEQEAFAEKMARLREGRELELLTEEEFRKQKEEIEGRHQKTLADIERRGDEERLRLQQQRHRERVRLTSAQFDAIASIAAGLNETLFNNSKAAAIAESIMLGIAGAIRTWNAYPFPWNILPTAAHIAGTAAQLSQIRSQNFRSGGTTAPSIAAAGAGGVPVAPIGGGGAGGGIDSTTTVNIALQGQLFGREQVRDLISSINDAVADGARIRVT